jgi:hypothetical protein
MRMKLKGNIQWLLYCMVHNNREMYTGDTGEERGLAGARGDWQGTGATGLRAVYLRQNYRNQPGEIQTWPKND